MPTDEASEPNAVPRAGLAPAEKSFTEEAPGFEVDADNNGVNSNGDNTVPSSNLLRNPGQIVVELTELVLQDLAGAKKLHQLRYPTCACACPPRPRPRPLLQQS